jgi:hypothetical protein
MKAFIFAIGIALIAIFGAVSYSYAETKVCETVEQLKTDVTAANKDAAVLELSDENAMGFTSAFLALVPGAPFTADQVSTVALVSIGGPQVGVFFYDAKGCHLSNIGAPTALVESIVRGS